MTGLELLKAPGTTAEEVADVISEHCPPVCPAECDRLACRECWLSWLTTGEPPKAEGPSDKQTAPRRAPSPYRPPTEAIKRAAERVREGNMEYTATIFTRSHDEAPQQP